MEWNVGTCVATSPLSMMKFSRILLNGQCYVTLIVSYVNTRILGALTVCGGVIGAIGGEKGEYNQMCMYVHMYVCTIRLSTVSVSTRMCKYC